MSAFLGPIHYWLYDKIKLQNDFANQLMNVAASHGIDVEAKLNEKHGVLPTEDLENIIDESNIHGWLQEKVSLVEFRLADLVTMILKEKQELWETLKEEAVAFGSSIGTKDFTTPKEVYQLLNNCLLDGMPCDHVNQLVSDNDTQIVWKRTQCIHEKYWLQVGGDVRHYYSLRNEMIKGLLLNTKFHYANEGEEYSIAIVE